MIQFTEEQLGTISNALRVAAEQFERNAREIMPTNRRLGEQFNRQALAATALYDLIGEREGIQS